MAILKMMNEASESNYPFNYLRSTIDAPEKSNACHSHYVGLDVFILKIDGHVVTDSAVRVHHRMTSGRHACDDSPSPKIQ